MSISNNRASSLSSSIETSLTIKWPLFGDDDRDTANDRIQEARQRAYEAVEQVYAEHHNGANYQCWLDTFVLENRKKTLPPYDDNDDDCSSSSSSEDGTTLTMQMLESNQVLEKEKAQLQARVQVLEDIKALLEKNNAMLREGVQLVGDDKALLEERVEELERSKNNNRQASLGYMKII